MQATSVLPPSIPLEITLPTALELCQLGLATLVDIRQSFEIEMKGAIPNTLHIPMFEMKVMLGDALDDSPFPSFLRGTRPFELLPCR